MNAKKVSSVFLFALFAFFCATASYGNSYQIWPSTSTPAILDVGADSPIELGVSFKSDVSGYITGIRFYKSANNSGKHVGNLWSNTGTLLASATFTNETASGWQQVNFSGPVAINANTRYVASYHSTGGHYSVTPAEFATNGVDNAPLHALMNTSNTPDGPYAYGNSSQFPTNTYNSGNYWVDVVFSSNNGGRSALPQLAVTPASASFGNVAIGTSNSQAFNLSNGGTARVTISQASVTGSGFSLSGLTTPLTIAPGKNAAFNVVFTPATAGNVSGSVSLVSNAPNSPLSIPLSGSGIASMRLLGANPSGLSFGNVNAGSSSSQKVTLTNNGNSNLTISSVNTSGSGYSASGVSVNTTLAPGQTATLNVTFAPTVAGSATGSVSVASNASNSPTTISLNGSGVAQSAGGAPTCGKSGDTSNHIPTDWNTFVPPGKGQSYVDPTFGCTVTRITDASKDVWTGSFYLPLSMGYATVSPFNANDSYLMVGDGWARRFVTDLSGNVVVPLGNVPGGNNGWYLWDATNAQVFYYTSGNSLMKGTISGSTVTASTVHQFSEYAAINFMDETDVSQDGAHVVVIGGDTSGTSPEQIFDYNFVTNSKGPVYTTGCTGSVGSVNNGCLHKLIQTPDNNVIIQFASDGTGPEQGNRLWTGSGTLPHLQDGTNHLDAGSDLSGNAVYISSVNGTSLSGATNPCPSGWGLDVRQIYNPTSAVCLLDNQPSWHVGYRGSANQPWVGLSFFDSGRSPSPEWFDNASNYTGPNASTWQLYEGEILVVRIDANNNSNYVYRLARAYSRSNEDFGAQPHAAISRSGKYIAFTSNMAYAHSGCPANFQTATNCADVYIIRVY